MTLLVSLKTQHGSKILISPYVCIDLFLTNQANCFQHSNVFKAGLSNFCLLTISEFKVGFQKLSTKTVNYLDYKNFNNKKFRSNISKLYLELLIWEALSIQSSVVLINMPLLKENIFVQMRLQLWLRNCTKPLWEDPN